MDRQDIAKGPRVVVIGGGTGSFTLLSGLKDYVRGLTALVSMADDGGSSGQLRDEFGVLPPGDVRQCLVALSSTPLAREVFNYRFADGSLSGHALGNIFLAALEKITGSFGQAVEAAGEVLRIHGRVEPITFDKVIMVMETPSGKTIKGQFNGVQSDFEGEVRPLVRLEPSATVNPAASSAIIAADLVVIAPGNLYCSIAPALVVDGVSDALKKTKAKLVYVCNLVTKPGQTDNFTVADYAQEIERFLGGAKLDYVLYNNAPPSDTLLNNYAHENEFPVKYDKKQFVGKGYAAKGLDFVARDVWMGGSAGDTIAHERTYIRHNPDRVARELMRIYFA